VASDRAAAARYLGCGRSLIQHIRAPASDTASPGTRGREPLSPHEGRVQWFRTRRTGKRVRSPRVAPKRQRPAAQRRTRKHDPNYKWVALSNTTLGVLMSAIERLDRDHLPARDLHRHQAEPARPGSTSYLLWIMMGYLLVTGRARRGVRAPGRHVRAGPHVTTPAS